MIASVNTHLLAVKEGIFILRSASEGSNITLGLITHLHANELGPALALRDVIEHGKLPGPHAARSDVPHLAALHQVVESLHRLFGGSLRIEAVDLKEVDVGRPEARKGRVHGIEDGGAAKPMLVHEVARPLEVGPELNVASMIEEGGNGEVTDNATDRRIVGNHAEALGEDEDFVPRDFVLET